MPRSCDDPGQLFLFQGLKYRKNFCLAHFCCCYRTKEAKFLCRYISRCFSFLGSTKFSLTLALAAVPELNYEINISTRCREMAASHRLVGVIIISYPRLVSNQFLLLFVQNYRYQSFVFDHFCLCNRPGYIQ